MPVYLAERAAKRQLGNGAEAGDGEGALVCEGNSGVVVKRCEATQAGKDAVVIAALRNSTVSLGQPGKPRWRVRTEDGGQVR